MGNRISRTRKSLAARGLALTLSVFALVGIRPAHGDPGDIFTLSAPAVTDKPPAATPTADGDASVATQTGAMTWRFPIHLPPGRGKASPSLSLAYNSQSAIYGTLASQWTMAGLPIISLDTSGGRLAPTTKGYTSSMAGGRPLVLVGEQGSGVARYRAQNDSSWTRYERYDTGPFYWRALSPDGTTSFFGHHGVGDDHTTGCAIISDEYAPLTQTQDEFGNAVDYIWRPGVDGECRIAAITWGQNTGAGVGYFAAVEFTYEASPKVCSASNIPVGSQTSYRSGTKIVTGASQLNSIRAAAFPPIAGTSVLANPIPASPDHTRTITLTYNTASGQPDVCAQPYAAFRALTKIQESAVGVDSPLVTLPAIDLTYNSAAPPVTNTAATTNPWAGSTVGFGSHDAYNLGWGYRFDAGIHNSWPTVEAEMVDLDGDGLIDRLVNEPFMDTASGKPKFCQARWWRNPGGGAPFVNKGLIAIPTLKWAIDPGITDPYAGGTHARANQTTAGINELCALNYQRTGYVNSHNNGELQCQSATGPTDCPTDSITGGHCSYGSDCKYAKTGATGNTYFAWRWFDVDGDRKPDLVGSPVHGGLQSYDLIWGSGVYGDPAAPPAEASHGGNIFGPFPLCPDQQNPIQNTYTAKPDDPSMPYTMCRGMFPYFVYYNRGNGTFGRQRTIEPGPLTHDKWGPLPDVIMYQPLPLESSTGDSSVLSAPVGGREGSTDLDGDGFPDAVYQTGDNSITWLTFLNTSSGQYGSNPYSIFGWPRMGWAFGVSPVGWLLTGSHTVSFSVNSVGVEGLLDLNGDGLADHWRADCDSCVAKFAWNDGTQFRTPGGIPEQTTEKAGADSYTYNLNTSGTSWVNEGVRLDSRREIDYDGDGRVDLLKWGQSTLTPFSYLNQGGDFGASPGASGMSSALNHSIVATQNRIPYYFDDALQPNYAWEIRSDALDLDGDGVLEGVDFGDAFVNPVQMYLEKANAPPQPRRLLASINNNRGAITSITYASMNSPTVEQAPADGYAMPQTDWVVASLTTTDSLAVTTDLPAGTTSTTGYHYKHPMYTRDDRRRYGFRGFEEVTTTSPDATGAANGAKTIERFSFYPDWSGRLQTRLVVPASTDLPTPVTGEVRSVEETTWEARTLFSGLLTTFHATLVDRWSCKNGQDELACRANTDTHARSVTPWTETIAPTSGINSGTPLLWESAVTRLQDTDNETAATSTKTGTRKTTTTFAILSDGNNYRVRSSGATRDELRSSGYVTYAKNATLWDATLTVATDEDVWFSNPELACTTSATHCARTHRTFDMTTGNVTERYKPVQWSAGGVKKESYVYDSRKLFVATETNDVGHVRDHTWEYGTGTQLSTLGPNIPPCAQTSPPTCPTGWPLKEEHRIRIDGLGRMIERYEAYATPGSNYQLFKVETNSYTDGPAASVTHQSAVDYNQYTLVIQFSQDKTELDGHGRPIKKTQFALGAAPNDAITSFSYRNDGTLSEVRVPDPTLNDTSTVSYTYSFDSLGRPRSMRRPDNNDPLLRSGVDLAYDGNSQTSTEVVGTPLIDPSVTTTFKDAFGRLVNVDEQLASSPIITSARTSYLYGPDDNVREIDAPQSVLTTLEHDLAGRRTAITRSSRTWRYGYDKNGNVTSELAPCTGTNCDASYTSTTVYDDLDRAVSKMNAPRGLSSADQTLFGSDHETFSYDGGWNAKGRIYRWKSFAPGASTPTSQIDPTWNVQGLPFNLTQTFNGAGYTNLQQSYLQYFTLAGQQLTVFFRDIVDGTTCGAGSSSSVTFDNRGFANQIQVNRCLYGANPPWSYVHNNRNVAGLVTKQYSINGLNTLFTYVESNWTYDKLGRVTSQTVNEGSPLVQVVKQQLAYLGNDDISTLDHWLGTANHKQFAFTFDKRHELTSAIEQTTSGSYFSSHYYYGDGGRFTAVNESSAGASGGNVLPRDVTYQYQGADPEQVTALVNQSNQLPLRSYAYDLAGNQTMSCAGVIVAGVCSGASLTYVYDGKNHLRRATKLDALGGVTSSEEYYYDQNGTRTQLVRRDSLGSKTSMRWFIEDTEAEYNATGTVTHAEVNVRFGGRPVARLYRDATGPSKLEYKFQGLADNTIAAVDQNSGAINASFSYAPFGEIVEATDGGASSTPPNGVAQHRHRMNDKYVDEISDLAYYGARYYDKLSMTWTQSDPLYRFAPDAAWTQPRKSNLYGFSLNNPLRYMDPDGRNPGTLVGAIIDFGEGVAPYVAPEIGALGLLVYAMAAGNQKAAEHGVQPVSTSTGTIWMAMPSQPEEPRAYGDHPTEHPEETMASASTDDGTTDAPGINSNSTDTNEVGGQGYVGTVPKPPRGKGSVEKSERDTKRYFGDKDREKKRAEQDNKCPGCDTDIDETNSEGHHRKRHADGGRTVPENHDEVCVDCHDKLHSPD